MEPCPVVLQGEAICHAFMEKVAGEEENREQPKGRTAPGEPV
ncbi:MAG: hypothetical protein OJF52_003396 [Nitrospira sp.]|jgi:hypothetical protein|nr:MAG: hypothetical protein OJF52_003396 [Nitrospira sp.]